MSHPTAREREAKIGEDFRRITEKHEMTILRDDGLYRHLRFQRPGTGMYGFDLVTWPGYLVIVGDAGADYIFSRLADMFEFFGSGADYINPQYWAEKLQTHGRSHDIARCFSYDVYRDAVLQWLDYQLDDVDLSKVDSDALRAAVDEQLLNEETGSEDEVRLRLRDFRHQHFELDAWEWDLREYDHHFIWNLWAIAWGVAEYRKAASS